MPAYSFQERFCPWVLDGSKPQTIRSRRKNQAKRGDTLYLYFALRTKYCKKLREEKCDNVKSLSVNERFGIVLYERALTATEIAAAILDPVNPLLPSWEILDAPKRDLLAWKDGFRPDGTTENNPFGSFHLMLRWWKQTHELPFVGDIIYWMPSQLSI